MPCRNRIVNRTRAGRTLAVPVGRNSTWSDARSTRRQPAARPWRSPFQSAATRDPNPSRHLLNLLRRAALDRTVLPIPEPDYPARTELDARKATPPPRFEVKAPAGAPNVLIVLIDDMGFGMPSAFGGPIHMPTADRLASDGPALQPVPHHGALLADAHGAAQRPQPPHEQHGRDHRDGHRVPGQHRAAPEQRGAARRDAAAQRLQHRLLRQEPRDRRLGGQPLRPDRPLADAVRASTSSTASSAARPTSGRRCSTTA